MIPAAMTGQAAGTLAALAIRLDCPVNRVPVAILQQQLSAAGSRCTSEASTLPRRARGQIMAHRRSSARIRTHGHIPSSTPPEDGKHAGDSARLRGGSVRHTRWVRPDMRFFVPSEWLVNWWGSFRQVALDRLPSWADLR